MESIEEESNNDLELRLQESDDEDVEGPFSNNGIVSDSSEEEKTTTATENRKRKKKNVVTALKKTRMANNEDFINETVCDKDYYKM